MGLFDSIVNHALHNVVGNASDQIGRAVGEAAGNVVVQGAENYTTDMRLKNEQKIKEKNLPAKCPHCGAPTEEKIVCEYCGCKVIDN